jgi:hypothetical protein
MSEPPHFQRLVRGSLNGEQAIIESTVAVSVRWEILEHPDQFTAPVAVYFLALLSQKAGSSVANA